MAAGQERGTWSRLGGSSCADAMKMAFVGAVMAPLVISTDSSRRADYASVGTAELALQHIMNDPTAQFVGINTETGKFDPSKVCMETHFKHEGAGYRAGAPYLASQQHVAANIGKSGVSPT